MGKARVVAPPPQDYVPEPLVSLPPVPEEVEEQEWIDGNLEEEIIEVENNEPSQEELERERIAQEKYEELQRKKVEEETRVSLELQTLREENKTLQREKEAAEKAREEQILKARQQATDKGGSQLNIVQARKPSLISKIKDFFRKRRIQLATIPRANYEQAIIHQASVAVPKMLDEIEKMHESLTILEELLTKHKEREKINQSEKHPRQ
jgi:hypothetical protein